MKTYDPPDLYPRGMVASYMPKRLKRNQTNIVVKTSSTQLLGPNPKRWAIIVGAPNANFTDQLPNTQIVQGASVASLGVKLSYTVPAGAQAILTSASFVQTTGSTAVAALQLVRGATTVNLQNSAQPNQITLQVPLSSGDIIQWNVTTLQAGGAGDFMIGITQTQGFGRVTISLANAAVLDQGVNQYPGQTPLILMYETIGDAIKEDIFAISANGTPTLGVWDFFT